MNPADGPGDPSGRSSGRVDHQPTPAPVPSAPAAITGPESLPSRAASVGAPERRARRRSRRQLEDVGSQLSERDRAVLDHLDRYRFLRTHHIEQLCFVDHINPHAKARACRRVLQRLAELRVIEHLEREIGGVRAGSQRYVWRVGVTGDRLLRADADAPRDRRREPSLRFLEHVLTVADCALRLTMAARGGAFELVRIETEPDNWQRYLSPGGIPEVLKPDLYAVTASGAYEDHWYLEVDRATESLPTVLKQCQAYETFRRSGRLQADIGVFPLVGWLVPSERRAAAIQGAIRRSRDLDNQLYRVTTHERVVELVASSQGGAA